MIITSSLSRKRRRARGGRFTSLVCERLEERALLAPLVAYEIRLLPPDAPLTTPDLTQINVGQQYDLVVTVQDVRTPVDIYPGVSAAWLDVGYDSSKTRVEVAEIQHIAIGPASGASGTFTLAFGDQTTAPITFSSNMATMASSIQSALSALGAIGAGNVTVDSDQPCCGGETNIHYYKVRFTGTSYSQDVPNMTVASQNLTGANNPTVSVTYGGDLNSGSNAYAFREAFRSRIATIKYSDLLSANELPNLIDDLGAFFNGPTPGPAVNEVVRARMKATAAGAVTFTPSVTDLIRPTHNTVMFNPASTVTPAQIDAGAPKTLTISPAIVVVANPDAATVAEDAGATTIDVLANDTATPPAGAMQVLAVTQPANGTVTFTAGNVAYTPAPNFSGTDAFSYSASVAGNPGAPVTASVTVTVTPSNDPPLLDAIADPAAILEDAAAQIVNLTGISAGPGESQALTVTAVSSNPGLIPHPVVTYASSGSAGSLSYQPAANQSGTATITVTMTDDGGGAVSRTFAVNVTAVNDPPSFASGSSRSVTDNGGAQAVPNWVIDIAAGPPDEAAQGLAFTVTNNNSELFTAQPAIDSAGQLTFTPAPNASGLATVTVVLRDDGGTANGGNDTSVAQTFTIEVTRPLPLNNTVNPLNVDGNSAGSQITPIDAVLVINYLNAGLGGAVPDELPPGSPYLDVDGDNHVSPIDAVIVINWLNAHPVVTPAAAAAGEGELESLDNAVGEESSALDSRDALFAAAADWFTPPTRRRRGR